MAIKSLPKSVETEPLLPPPSDVHKQPKPHSHFPAWWKILVISLITITVVLVLVWLMQSSKKLPPFYSQVKTPRGICDTKNDNGVSHAGYIGLKGDGENKPKRSFFWYFEAQENPEDAPVILTVGGGPGTTGMMNALQAREQVTLSADIPGSDEEPESHCIVTANATTPNPNAWTERYNLLALDHPIGAGFSYGTMVNNSRAAAVDVYDFIQKFYNLYPHLAKNKFIINGGSYGGTYVPHIATVINEQNRAVSIGKGDPGAIHINLESLMISNPFSDPISHFRWWLHQACYNTILYNSTTCTELFAYLPTCLEGIQFGLENSTVKNRVTAWDTCQKLYTGAMHGTMVENVSKKCDGSIKDCLPKFSWLSDFMNRPTTKEELGVPEHLIFTSLSEAVLAEFAGQGDYIQQPYLLYEPLLKDGIRLLHYVGALDANCGWPGIFSFLKLLRSPYQNRFINAPDVPWPTVGEATVRVVGEGAGDMSYVLVADAGHFVSADQPALVKNIVDHWIDNWPFV